MAAIAETMGTPFLPWQRQVALVGGEIDPDTGLPAYREVVLTIPRQSGKTTLSLAWQIHRAIAWEGGRPQRIAYSAQTGIDARRKLVEDQMPILDPLRKTFGIMQMNRGIASEAVIFRNGSRIGLLANSEKSGHGKTLALAIKDELFADADYRRDQAIIPATVTVDDAQIITMSTAGTETSIPLAAAVSRGRALAEAGTTQGTAYFEWSADTDADPADPATWWSCMPALGHTQSVAAIRHAYQSLSDEPDEFRRAFLNIANRTAKASSPINPEWWKACRDGSSRAVPPFALAFDIPPDRASASIAVAAASERDPMRVHVEVVAYARGTHWLVPKLTDMVKRWKPTAVLYDPAGPASSAARDVEGATPVTLRDHAAACGHFHDAVKDKTLTQIGQAPLDAAIAEAVPRKVHDAWLWTRQGTADISPLVAVTLAYWAKTAPTPEPLSMDNLGIW